MIVYPHVRMDLMSSKGVAEYLKTNDMVILPVGCMEMHGPMIPLSCDSACAWASSLLLADVWGCLCLPPLNYSFPGATGPWPGSVDISPQATVAFLKEIVTSLLKGGFRRVVMYGTHAPLAGMFQMVIRSIYQETREIVVGMTNGVLMPDDLMMEEFGHRWREDILVLASLKILGLHGSYDPATDVEKAQTHPFETLTALGKQGAAVPWVFNADHQHTGIHSDLTLDDADRAIEVMKKAAARKADLPATFAKYQEQMREMMANPPWEKDDVWSV
jgi:creatinine amidohydrolase/Fe(II)-dependent formamide hydrolase-like protein